MLVVFIIDMCIDLVKIFMMMFFGGILIEDMVFIKIVVLIIIIVWSFYRMLNILFMCLLLEEN